MLKTNLAASLRLSILASAACVGLFSLPGCGESAGPSGTVSGKITNQSQPLATGTVVTFMSDAGAVGTGIVEEGGTYRIKTTEGDELPAGDYKVSLSPPIPPPVDPAAAMKASMESGGKPPADNWNVPEKYRQAATSGWTASVKEGDNTFDFTIDAAA